MDWLDYREKLKIGFNDESKFVLLKAKVFNVLNIAQIHLSGLEYVSFCNMIGKPIKPDLVVGQEYPNKDIERFDHCIVLLRESSSSLCDFLSTMIAFINTLSERPEPQFGKSSCVAMLENMLNESHIPFETLEDAEGHYVFPKGVEELDDALISQIIDHTARRLPTRVLGCLSQILQKQTLCSMPVRAQSSDRRQQTSRTPAPTVHATTSQIRTTVVAMLPKAPHQLFVTKNKP